MYFQAEEAQLYLLELQIQGLELIPDKLHECRDNCVLLKVKCLTLPVFAISPSDSESVNSHNETSNRSLVFPSGRSCLFGKRPRDLVREMQTTPLRIGVFCVGDTYPIAELTLPLTGCLCDQIAMAMNDSDHLPQAYALQGCHEILDPGRNPSGNLTLQLKIIPLGKHVTTRYHALENSLVFKRHSDEAQYLAKRVVPPGARPLESQQHSRKQSEEIVEPVKQEKHEDLQHETNSKKKSKRKKKKL